MTTVHPVLYFFGGAAFTFAALVLVILSFRMIEVLFARKKSERGTFLLPYAKHSVEEAGYKFVNAKDEWEEKYWWRKLVERAENKAVADFLNGLFM